jgi:hypothetical protein
MDRPKPQPASEKKERSSPTTVRDEVVDILANAVFTLILNEEAARVLRLERLRQSECS